MFQAHHSRITRSNEGSPSSPPMAATTAAAASGTALNTSTDSNLDDDPNSSIINKVRSRVSSILPDALSKWFSPAKRPRDTSGGSSGTEHNTSGNSGTPAGRNGNLLIRGNRLRELSSNDTEEQGTEEQYQQPQQHHYEDDDEEEQDEEHAPPTRKKKRLEEGFNTSLVEFNEDLSAVPGPSGLNISAIERRSSLPAAAQLPRYRNTFSSSTPSTSPQQQQHQQQTSTAISALNRLQRTSLISYTNRTTTPYNFGAFAAPINEEHNDEAEQTNESISSTIRHRKSIREVSSRKRLNIPPMAVDRSTSEPPAPIFGRKFAPQTQQQLLHQRQQEEEGSSEELPREDDGEGNVLSNGNMNESASESSSVSNLNLSQTEGQIERSRRLSGFMGNSRSKRLRVGGSTGDLCFSSHLETEKSLFSMKNSGQSGRPAFNASLYGSTSSLGSTNSSLFANSPFYNGRTMYGGASAYSSRREARQKALRVPVHIRPSSSLSNFSSSNASLASDTSALSNTAKRILEIMNQCSGPLNEARKLGSSLSLNSTLASAKVPGLVQARKRFNEEDLSLNRSIRMSSPRTPYNRPLSATGIGSSSSSINKPPTTELQIPTMSQLLQMKRLQTNTESVRRMATESSGSTVLNEPTHYKLPNAEADDSNNNVKHNSKMRNKLHRIREESHSDRGNKAPVPLVNLPEVQLAGLKSVPKFDIKLPITSSMPSEHPKTKTCSSSGDIDDSVKGKSNNVYKFSSPAKLNVSANAATDLISKAKNDFRFSNPEPIGSGKSSSSSSVTSLKLGGFQFNPEMAKPKVAPSAATPTSPSTLNTPLTLKSGSCLDALKSSSAVPELKAGSCLEALGKPISQSVGNGTISSFGNTFKLAGSNKWECDACMVRNDPEKTKCVACETPKPGSKAEATKSTFSFGATPLTMSKTAPPATTTDSGFKALVAQQSAKWECSDCMTRNNADQLKCACCEKAKPGSSATTPKADVPAAVKSMFSMPISSSSDQTFKALVAQQSANKWECSACMTRNEASRSKCACCEQAKPSSTPENAPSFSFGSKPSSTPAKFSFGVSQGSDGKEPPKTTGFSFGVPSSSSTGSTTSTNSGFSFGSVTSTTSTTSSDDKPKFSFGSGSTVSAATTATPASGFSFSNNPVASSDTTDSSKKSEKEPIAPVPTVGSGGFTFGTKTVTSDSTKSSETVTSTTNASGFSFGSTASKPAETARSTGFSFATPNTTPANSSTTSATDQTKSTVTFGTLAAESMKPSSKLTMPANTSFGFESAAATSAKSEESKPTILGTGMFAFGSPKPAAASASIAANSTATVTASPVSETKSSVFSASTTGTSSVPIFGGAQKPVGPSITPSFSFGAAAAGSTSAAADSAATSTKPAFSFGSNASKPTETSTTTTTASTVPLSSPASNFVFGQSSQSTNKVVPTFGAAASADKPTFGSFGGAASTATASSTAAGSSIFGSTTSGFNFGGAVASTTSSKPAEATTSAFTFGASKSNSSLTTNATPVFGSPAAATGATNPIFGSPATNTPTFGSFGSATGNTHPTPTFGSSTFGTASTAPAGSASGSIFGQAAASSAPTFGAASSSSAAPIFGAASPAFGPSSAFGSSASANTATGDEPQSKKMFEFGSNSTVNSQPVAASFQFGTSSSNNNNNNNENTAKPFSFSANSAPSFNFTAGSNVGQTATPVAPPAFQFGASAMPQQNPFAATSIAASNQQQPAARRKIRATRRITPR